MQRRVVREANAGLHLIEIK